MSLFRDHVAKVKAAAEAKDSGEAGSQMQGDEHQQTLGMLGEHKRELKAIKSVEKKIEHKARIIGEYRPYLDGVLSADAGGANPIIGTLAVWSFDTGDFDTGLELAKHMAKHDLAMPDQYKRDLYTVVADEIADATIKDIDNVSLKQLQRAGKIIGDHDIPDQAQAKFKKAYGYKLRAKGKLELAQASLTRALELNSKVGVKKDLDALAREIKKAKDSTK